MPKPLPAVAGEVQDEAKLGQSSGVHSFSRVRNGLLENSTLVSGGAQPLTTFEQTIDPLLADPIKTK